MGSRIMHLVIANRIAESLPIVDKSTFLLGGIAPDAVSPKDFSLKVKYKTILEVLTIKDF